MDDNMVISSCSSSSLIPSSLVSAQQKLQFLLQNQQHWWIYAIFWQTSTNSCSFSLVWGEGHLQGIKSPLLKPNKKPVSFDEGGSSMLDDFVSDAEWFYMMSPSKTHPLNRRSGSTIASAYTTGASVWLCGARYLHNCERAKEAYSHGLHTFVCIPVSNGVLELGSGEVIQENWSLIQQARSLFGSLSNQHSTKPNELRISGGITFYESGLVGAGDTNQALPISFIGSSEDSDTSEPLMSQQKVVKKRGRKSGAARVGQAALVSHMEAERQRREKMNSRFCALRSVVPTVSRMDKASLLSDAVGYINELKDKINTLELQLQMMKVSSGNKKNCNMISGSNYNPRSIITNSRIPLEVDVNIIGNEAIIGVKCENVNHPSARLMIVLEQLNLQVNHASISTVEQMMLQDVVVKVPRELESDVLMKFAITSKLLDS